MSKIISDSNKDPKKEWPHAEKKKKILTKHGDRREDDYFWMRERDTAPVLNHLNAENSYTEKKLNGTEALQAKLFSEIKNRIKEDDSSAPYRNGEYYYYTRYEKGGEYAISCRKKGSLFGPEEIILNVNELARGQKYFDVGRIAVSFDQNWLLYAVDTVGRRFYDLHFKNLLTGEISQHSVKATTGNAVWLNDNKTILFGKQDPETLRAEKIFRYEIGGSDPELIYEEKDEKFFVYVSKSLTQNEVYIHAESSTCSEWQFANAHDSRPEFAMFAKRRPKHEYSLYDGDDRFFILTNDKARNFRLLWCPKDKTSRQNWREVVPHRKDVLVEDALVLKNWIVLEERKNGLTQLSYFSRTQTRLQSRGHSSKSANKNRPALRSIRFPDPAYVVTLGTNAEYDADEFRYDYESLNRPETVFNYDFQSRESSAVKTYEVPTYNANLYASKRAWATSHDGVKVPISIVYRKDRLKKGKNPILVYGYGSYGISDDPYFRRAIISLLDRGFVYAIAHIRGGSEMGRHWYENGKLKKKKNTFNDFVACTEFLIRRGWGARGSVYAMGGSAGGLLMGAVINMRPDLYNGVIAAVPFVDVVTTMLDKDLPLTTNEYEEWGNPNKPADYRYIKSYSPYDNIRKQAYPNLLVTTGYHDSQVQYWEPAKWVAKLREHTTQPDRLLLLKTEMGAGHSGVTGRFESLKDDALEYAFLLMLENIKG